MYNRIKKFRDDESGAAAIELLLCLPILIWALLSTFIFFDAFRAKSINTRAGLTIADMFSRERTPVTGNYIDNASNLLQFLTEAEDTPDLRVTVYEYTGPIGTGTYRRVWSEARGYDAPLTDVDFASGAIKNRLPIMANGTTSILVETRAEYTPPFDLILAPFPGTLKDGATLETFTVITPRFDVTICYQETAASLPFCRLSDLP